ncbi:MAG: CBS domain-containing protein [Gemmatimonadota bacterium]|nr:CBS domain-containing protein [Gemmatimonadota bacterium]
MMSVQEALSRHLTSTRPSEAAAVLETLPDRVVAATLADMDVRVAATVLARMAPHRAVEVLELQRETFAPVVEALGVGIAATLLRRVEPESRQRLLDSLEPGVGEPLRHLLNFPDHTAGALMDPQVLALPEDMEIREAVAQIRKHPDHVRYALYVVDRQQRLVGTISIRELFLANPKKLLGTVATTHVLSIRADLDHRSVVEHPAWNEAPSLPVVDASGVYVGAIRYRMWRRVVAQLATRGDDTTRTVEALGDLFWAGIVSMVGAVTQAAVRPIPSGLHDSR